LSATAGRAVARGFFGAAFGRRLPGGFVSARGCGASFSGIESPSVDLAGDLTRYRGESLRLPHLRRIAG
jgi:hypothetical protein